MTQFTGGDGYSNGVSYSYKLKKTQLVANYRVRLPCLSYRAASGVLSVFWIERSWIRVVKTCTQNFSDSAIVIGADVLTILRENHFHYRCLNFRRRGDGVLGAYVYLGWLQDTVTVHYAFRIINRMDRTLSICSGVDRTLLHDDR